MVNFQIAKETSAGPFWLHGWVVDIMQWLAQLEFGRNAYSEMGGLGYFPENARESCGSSWIAHRDRIEGRTWALLYGVEQRRDVYVSLSYFTHLKRHACKSVQSSFPFWTRSLFEAFGGLLVDNTS